MRLTVLKQMSKRPLGKDYHDFEKNLEKIKWYLWHGNVFQALKRIEFLEMDFAEFFENKENKKFKIWQTLNEFMEYIRLNSQFIPNYGERYRQGEAVSSAVADNS